MIRNDSNASLSTSDAERALLHAIEDKDINNVIKYLDRVDIGKRDQYGTILHRAVGYNTSEPILKLIIQKFKEKKISLDLTDNSNRNALDCACLEKDFGTIKLLIETGVDYKHQIFDNTTYLECFLKNNPDKSREVLPILEERSKQNRTVINRPQTSSWFLSFFHKVRAGAGYSAIGGQPDTADTDSGPETSRSSSRASTQSESESKSDKPKMD